MNLTNHEHHEYNQFSESGEFVCNGHFPRNSAEIVCLDDKSATWLRANTDLSRVHWQHPRILILGTMEDALRIVGKAVRDGLRVTTNHIPAVTDSKPNAEHRIDIGAGEQEIPRRVATPKERAQMVERQDPNFKPTKEMNEYLDLYEKIKDEARNDWPWLDFGKAWLPHDYQFDSPHFFDFLKKRKYATYHDAQMDGYVPRTTDIALLVAEFVGRIGVLKTNHEFIVNLRRGRTNDGAPLVLGDTSSGYKPVGLREFKAVLPDALAKSKADGSLQQHLDNGTIFEAQSGVYVELIEVYAHPEIAAYLKKTVADEYSRVAAEWKRATKKPTIVQRALGFLSSKHGRRKPPVRGK